jgi:hypothetical protein
MNEMSEWYLLKKSINMNLMKLIKWYIYMYMLFTLKCAYQKTFIKPNLILHAHNHISNLQAYVNNHIFMFLIFMFHQHFLFDFQTFKHYKSSRSITDNNTFCYNLTEY